MNVGAITVNVRILVGGQRVSRWRVRVLGLCAWLLGVPVDAGSGHAAEGSR